MRHGCYGCYVSLDALWVAVLYVMVLCAMSYELWLSGPEALPYKGIVDNTKTLEAKITDERKGSGKIRAEAGRSVKPKLSWWGVEKAFPQ